MPVQPPNRPAVTLTQYYNDLDLMGMGVIDAAEAYRETGGRFSWMEPWYAGPFNYLAGVFVALDAHDFLYFGFDSDHRQLGVYRSDGTHYGHADLGPDYHLYPLLHHTGVALRVVHTGHTLVFQARYDDSAFIAHLYLPDRNIGFGPPPPEIPGLFAGLRPEGHLGPPASSPDFTGFKTVAQVGVSRPTVAIGLIAKTTDTVWADAVYSHLETFVPYVHTLGQRPPTRWTPHTVYPLSTLPPELPPKTAFDRLPAGVHLHLPVKPPAPIALLWNGRLRLRPPAYAENTETDLPGTDPRQPPYDHSRTVDRAPKVVLAAPAGEFAFGTSVAMRRTVFRRSAGGWVGADPARGKAGMDLWGRAHSVRAQEVTVLPGPELQAPADGTYKMAFIVCAPNRSDITADHIDSLNVLGEYWDVAFEQCTRGRRKSSSQLA